MNRRNVLSAGLTGIGVGIAGCLGVMEDNENGGDENDDILPDEAVRFARPVDEDDIYYGESDAFTLTHDPDEVALGDTVQIALRNTTDSTQSTGVASLWYLERQTPGGWKDRRWWPDGESQPLGTDLAIPHQPGEGFDWEIELTPDGVKEASPYGEEIVVANLEPGEYRFIFEGITYKALATTFDVTD